MNPCTSGSARRWPAGGSAVRGGILTLIDRAPRTPVTVALMLVSPVATTVTSPDADTVATEGLSLSPGAALVRFAVGPFGSVAVAVHCEVTPFSVKLLSPVTATLETVGVCGDGWDGVVELELLLVHAAQKTVRDSQAA